MIFWFFGFPGIGKDYVAGKLSKLTGIKKIDADDFLTDNEKRLLKKGSFTKADRLFKLSRITKRLKELLKKHKNIAVVDSLPDNDSRLFIINSFSPDLVLIHVKASKKTHMDRLSKRKDHFFTIAELKGWIKKHWEEVEVDHVVLENENDDKLLEKNLLALYNRVNN